MSWDDDDFERDLMAYSEIEAVRDVQSVPKTIQMYQQRIQTNNQSSIFDADYTLPDTNNDGESREANNDEPLLEDEPQVIRVISGRGRGGRNVFHRPGDPIGSGLPDNDRDVFQQLRKVAPIGYGNEITETAVRAHHKAKGTGQQKNSPKISKSNSPATPLKNATPVEPICSKSSPTISKSNSPAILKNETPVEPKPELESSSSLTVKQTTIYVSGTSTPSSRSSDVDSSDYFTSHGQMISDSSYGAENSNGIEESDSESDSPITTETAVPNHQAIQAESKPEAAKPAPISEMLNRNRNEYKLQQRKRQMKQDELATQLKIQEILNQDFQENEVGRMRLLNTSPSSRSTSRSSIEDVPSWRRRTNSPPRYSWGRKNQDKEMLNLQSTLDFPPLK